MSEADRATLQNLLVENYNSLSRRLARRLGSEESADEALQDTFLRLQRGAEIGDVRSPKDYLFKIALNIAADQRRARLRKLTTDEVDALLDIADDAPTPERVVEARSELQALLRAMEELPERRREIFKAALLEKVPRRDLAIRFGVSVRTIDFEVQRALEHGMKCLADTPLEFALRGRESSTE